MNKGDVVKFADLQIGDYFSDNNRQKFRRIPSYELDLEFPDFPAKAINAFHVQTQSLYFLEPDDEFIFIAHSTWDEQDRDDYSIQESELEHQLEFFQNYFGTLSQSLQTIETSDNIFDDEHFQVHEVTEFVNLMRSSFFVSLYSYLEAWLNSECRISQQKHPQIKILLDDIHGAGIHKAKIYLEKVLETSFPFGSDGNWKQIQKFNQIRNCIVHAESKVADKDLRKYIESHPHLHCEHFFGSDYVILDDGFCEHAISIIGEFLRSMLYHRRADNIF